MFKQLISKYKQFYKFLISGGVAAMANFISRFFYSISVFLADYAFPYISFNFYPEAVAHAIGIAVPTVISFIGHKRFSFKEENIA